MKVYLKKTLILVSFLLLISSSLLPKGIKSQESEEYLTKRDIYLNSREDFLSAKQSYFNYQTLQTKEILFQKLRSFLFARDNFLQNYLKILLNEGEEYPESDSTEIKDWLVWLVANRKEVEASATLDSLVESGSKLANSYPEMERSIYFFLTRMTIAQENKVVLGMEEIKLTILKRIDEVTIDKGIVFQWLEEVDDKIKIIGQEQAKALEEMEKSQARRKGDGLRSWRKAEKYLITANQHLKESLDFIDEILISLEQ